MCPPPSLQFITLFSSKKARLSNTSSAGLSASNFNHSSLQLLVNLLALKDTPKQLTKDKSSKGPVSSPPKKSHIEGYIDFLGIHNQEHTIDILLTNGFHSHKLFKSSGLAGSKIRSLGLTLVFVTMLFDNMEKYEHTLASSQN